MAAFAHLQEYWRAYLLNLIFVVLLLTTHTLAYGDEVSSGEFRLLTSDGHDAAQLQSTDVSIEVNGLLARVVVRQRFYNAGSRWVEGEYVFPLPTNSAVDYMAMTVGERKIVGEIRAREQAKAIYHAAKNAGKKASLMAQQRPNLFTNRVANVGPGETIEVELHYLETLHYDQGRFSLRVPTTLTPRYIPGQAFSQRDDNRQHITIHQASSWAKPTDQVPDAPSITPPMQRSDQAAPLTLTASINAGLPLAAVKSLHHPATIRQQLAIHRIQLEPGAKLDRDVVLEWQPDVGQAPMATAFGEQIGDDHYVLFMVMPPQASQAASILPRETIFVIDTSGSMAGTSIKQAKQALLSGLALLKPGDRFNVVEFNSHTRPLWRDALPASPTNRSRAVQFVEGLHASGGTEMKGALEFALQGEEMAGFVRQVIFITDGSVGNEAALFNLIARRRGNSRLFTVGIGSAPNSHFMQKAAEAGRGSFTYVGSQNDVQRTISDLFYKLENPLLTNIELDVGAATTEQFPRKPPDLYAGEPLVVAARFSGPLPDYVLINGQRNGEQHQQQLALPRNGNASDVSKLWARKKLHQLYDDERNTQFSSNDSQALEAVKTEITELAIAHQLMSKYTSFIAVEQTISRPADAALDTQTIPNAMPAGNTMAIPLPAGALGLGKLWLFALLALFGLSVLHWGPIKARHRHAA
ncbi:MAG: marine proteobacterial sortase target protein [Cellvibrionaceae bacterium]